MPRDLPSEWLLLLTLFSIILISGCCSVPQLSTQGVTQCMRWNCTSINAFYGVRGLGVWPFFLLPYPITTWAAGSHALSSEESWSVFSVLSSAPTLYYISSLILSRMKNHVGFCNGGWVSGYMSWSQPGACNIDCFSLSKVFELCWTVCESLTTLDNMNFITKSRGFWNGKSYKLN